MDYQGRQGFHRDLSDQNTHDGRQVHIDEFSRHHHPRHVRDWRSHSQIQSHRHTRNAVNQPSRQNTFTSLAGRSQGARTNERFVTRDIGNRANGNDERRNNYIGYKKLQTWAEETNAGKLLLWIDNESDALIELLERDIKPDWYILLAKICGLVLTADHQRQILMKFVKIFVSSHFLDQNLFNFAHEKKHSAWDGLKEFCEQILLIVKKIILLLPGSASKCTMPLSLLETMVQDNQDYLDRDVKDGLLHSICLLKDQIRREEWRLDESKMFHKKAIPHSHSEAPPENFRILSIIPEACDLTDDSNPFLRANIARGSYKDEDHYLDVQFRLMREDFMRPLRESINEFKKRGCKKDFRSSDIRLYFDVHIIGMTRVNGINHVLQFDVTSLKSVKWEHSKRFLNGSLLCLSKDNFETVLFATMTFRDPKNLKKGIIHVEFRNRLETVFCTTSSETFIMAETATYFEAYCPILEGLKETSSDNSLKKYFIFGEKKLHPPKYLLGAVQKYDLSSLTLDQSSTSVPILNTMSWPPVENMTLNESQREAVQLALTKELAIIQGPPGTGKTYVGLKVMKVLLKNQENMAGNKNSSHNPILVVCYTNHALDQFLEGVVTFCQEGVVRVGGKSSSSLMESLNLKNCKKKENLDRSVKRALWNKNTELNAISRKINDLKLKIDSLVFKIQNETVLEAYMSDEHYHALMYENNEPMMDHFSKSKTSLWLKTLEMPDRNELPNLIKSKLIKLVLQIPAKFIKEIRSEDFRKSYQSLPVLERACIYQGWLRHFRSKLDLSVYNHQIIFQESKMKMLSDSDVSTVIHSDVLNCILSLAVDLYPEDRTVEGWVLGLNKTCADQLDDIENLMIFLSQSEVNNDDDFDDIDGAVDVQNARNFDDDRKEEEEVAKETWKLRQKDDYLMMKAEKLGLLTSGEDNDQNEEGAWQTVNQKKPLKFSKLKQYLEETQPMTEEEERTVIDLWALDLKKRYSLYNLWIQKYRQDLAEDMKVLVQQYEDAMAGKKEIRIEIDLDILRRAKVIGLTTTGAAKYRKLMQAVACRIIVVEEAAEVLEAHIITALNENCQHLILIGDHQQLRPNPTVYALAKDYHLDLSLFERLINNGIQHVTLKEQHRMRQSISKIMRHIYPNLQDHVSVTNYDNVCGMERNIFFINHGEYESHVEDSRSKSNSYEASFLVAFLKYLLSQGYEPGQITILATYIGQVLILKKELRATQIGQGVRVTTVDNFQGEENDIILLSMVRSNAQSNVGFLKVDNRVCVALSRGKKGLYAIGNFEMLSSQSKLWEKIMKTAKDDRIIGDTLPVVCANHPSFRVEISCPEDFEKKCPDGGCGRPCEFRLKCGHSCPLKCHRHDSRHEKVKCTRKCAFNCPQGHPCKKWCSEVCGKCTEKVEKIIPRCGHSDTMPCYEPAQLAICSKPCGVVLQCQHSCQGKCGECHKNKEHAKCRILSEYFWPCDHIVKVPCYMKPSEYPCPKKCQSVLECGHKCTGTCSTCLEGTLHIGCNKVCSKVLPCGHKCVSLCGIPCPPCSQKCSNFCRHSKCNINGHKCGDKCIPCQEPCLNKCSHGKCGKKCHEECDIEPCQERCRKTVPKCKHPCSGFCGELCVCAQCDTVSPIPQVTSCNQKLEEEKVSQNEVCQKIGSQTLWSSVLIKIHGCGHTFYVNELNLYIENIMADDHIYCLPCPVCQKPINNTFWYDRFMKLKELKKQQEKLEIRQKSHVTSDSKIKASKGQQIVGSKDLNGNWHAFVKTNIDDLSTNHEVISLNVKCKWAYILGDIEILGKGLYLQTFPLKGVIGAVQKLQNNITCSQMSNFQIELQRLLLHLYFHEVNKLCHVTNSTELKNRLDETRIKLEKKTLALETLTQIWKFAQSKLVTLKENCFTTQTGARFVAVTKKVEIGIKILESEKDEMLCDLTFS